MTTITSDMHITARMNQRRRLMSSCSWRGATDTGAPWVRLTRKRYGAVALVRRSTTRRSARAHVDRVDLLAARSGHHEQVHVGDVVGRLPGAAFTGLDMGQVAARGPDLAAAGRLLRVPSPVGRPLALAGDALDDDGDADVVVDDFEQHRLAER